MRMATVGENIRKHRKAQGLSVVGLAEKVGMTEGAIRHYESGIRTPGEEQLKKIARALDVSPKMLEDHKIESARDLVGTLLQLEDASALQEKMALQNRNSEKFKKVQHDMKKHLLNAASLVEKGKFDTAAALLKDAGDNIDKSDPLINIESGSDIVDAIIASKSAVCVILSI